MISYSNWPDAEKLIFLRSRYAAIDAERYALQLELDFPNPSEQTFSWQQTKMNMYADTLTKLQAEIEALESSLSDNQATQPDEAGGKE